jgi:hypothetical protein
LSQESKLSPADQFQNFSRFTTRRSVAKFLNRYEIFKKVLNVHGSIVECGVNQGQGLFSWLHFSSIFEPSNHSRRVIGFDTFQGFTNINSKDSGGLYENKNENWKEFVNSQSLEEIKKAAAVQNSDRFLSQIPKVEIVPGDATKTIPDFLQNNKHLIVALLHLDFDVYPPTKVALEQFLPRMPKGAVIAFDELNDPNAPGETLALLESVDIRKYKLERNSFDSNLSYIVID